LTQALQLAIIATAADVFEQQVLLSPLPED
jgi:hypothetical protein